MLAECVCVCVWGGGGEEGVCRKVKREKDRESEEDRHKKCKERLEQESCKKKDTQRVIGGKGNVSLEKPDRIWGKSARGK